jgi:hypothetical protein
VKKAWVEQLDFSTLEKVSGSYVSDELRDREDDIIWWVRWGDDWLYVYLLLEFQSSIDKYMAVRVMSYLGLLYQDLVRQKAFTPNGKLPDLPWKNWSRPNVRGTETAGGFPWARRSTLLSRSSAS